jgi:hypothetical protein
VVRIAFLLPVDACRAAGGIRGETFPPRRQDASFSPERSVADSDELGRRHEIPVVDRQGINSSTGFREGEA